MESVLPSVSIPYISTKTTNNNILITGANGFLGSHITSALSNDSDRNLVLLLRNPNSPLSLSNGKNIDILKGDITKIRLGLSQEEYDKLLVKVDTVIHCAAMVDMNEHLEFLMETNVIGTKNVLDFVKQSGSTLHYISSLATILSENKNWSTNNGTPIAHNGPISNVDLSLIYGGYAQSKWMAEYLLSKHLGGEENRLVIHRPAMICPVDISQTSSYKDNYLIRLIRTCLEIKAFPVHPRFSTIETDITPVNYFVERFLHCFKNNQSDFYNLASISLESLFQTLLKSPKFAGSSFISTKKWVKLVRDVGPSTPFYPFLFYLSDWDVSILLINKIGSKYIVY
eukprot:gene5916-7365_t